MSRLGESEILEELKNSNYNDLEDLVYRFQLTYDEIIELLGLKYIPTKRTGYSLNPVFYEVIDINKTLEHILPHNVRVSVTLDGVRIKSSLKVIQTLIFTNKNFSYEILGFTRSRSYPLDDIDGFDQLKVIEQSTLQELIKFI